MADSEQRFGEFFIKCGKGLTKFFKPLAKVRKKFKNSLHRFDKGLAKSWLSLGSVLAKVRHNFCKGLSRAWHRVGKGLTTNVRHRFGNTVLCQKFAESLEKDWKRCGKG